MNLARIVESHPDDAVALVARGVSTTYGELRRDVAAMRGYLVGVGVEPTDRVAICCGNGTLFVVAYLAALGIGASVVPLNPTSPAPELSTELRAVDPRVVVLEPAATAAWRQVDTSALRGLRAVLATDGHGLPGVTEVSEALRCAPVAIVDVDDSAVAALIFTSGTAGAPRAALLSHRNLATNLEQVAGVSPLRADDVVYGVLPLFHIFGLNVMLGCALWAGASVVLVQRFDPVTALETITERGVTVFPGAPPVWGAFVQLTGAPSDAFARVRIALTGASKMPEATTRAMLERFGLPVSEGYGLTEASPVVTSSSGRELRPGSVGHPVPGVEVRIVDDEGADVEDGDSGEIWVRGDNVFLGYLDDPESTARVLTHDGWLRTGDVGLRDDDGYLYLVDRVKDLIIVSGFNVYPAEVEAVLESHPGVAQAAVVGVEHPHTGEAVRAYVVPVAGVHLDEDSIIDHARGFLARYKCPSKVLVVDALPTGGTGKVLRRSLG